MNSSNLQINILIKLFVWITIISFIMLGTFYKSIDIQLESVPKIIGLTVATIVFLWFLFDKWAWKLRIFRPWLINYPNLNGTWTGTLTKTSTGTVRNIQLVVHQTLTKISCVYRSETLGINRSYEVGIIYDPNQQVKRLIFSYNYCSNQNTRNSDHRGTCDLDISEVSETRSLNGRYWTCRDNPTTGTIALSFYSKKKYDSYQKNLATR